MHSPFSEAITDIDSFHHYYHYQGSLFYTGRGDHYRKTGQPELACADYKKALFLDHHNEAAKQGLRRLEGAIEDDITYDTAIHTSASLHDIDQAAMAMYQQALASHQLSYYDQAIALNARSHEEYHKEASLLHMERGEWYEAQGEWALAMNDYHKAIDIDSGNEAAKMKRDRLYAANIAQASLHSEGDE